MSSPDRPLVSFLLMAHNQEEYIREAVEGAFSQTYAPLEIILSDDCSTDGTYEVVREMMVRCPVGPAVVLRKNPRNLGLSDHLNVLMEIARGDFIVVAAGDDVSNCDRVGKLVEHWLARGKPVGCFYSASTVIDRNGKSIGVHGAPPPAFTSLAEYAASGCPGAHGATNAWHRDVFQKFGPFNPDLIAEDRALSFRAAAFDGSYYLDDRLVRYRSHNSNLYSGAVAGVLSPSEIRERLLRVLRMELRTRRQFLADLEKPPMRRKYSGEELEDARIALVRSHETIRHRIAFEEGGFGARLRVVQTALFGKPRLAGLACKMIVRLFLPQLEGINRVRLQRRGLRDQVARCPERL